MGAIIKKLGKKRKILTISVPKKSTDVNPFKQKRRNIHGWKRKVEWPTKKDKDRFSEAVKREVVIKKKSKPSKTKLADTWQDRRIQAINRKIGAGQPMGRKSHSRRIKQHDFYIDEASDIYKSTAPTKKVYKSIQKKWHSLDPDQKSKIYMKKAKRDPKSFHFDKKKFGKK